MSAKGGALARALASALVLAVLALAVAACGVKRPPQPPVDPGRATIVPPRP